MKSIELAYISELAKSLGVNFTDVAVDPPDAIVGVAGVECTRYLSDAKYGSNNKRCPSPSMNAYDQWVAAVWSAHGILIKQDPVWRFLMPIVHFYGDHTPIEAGIDLVKELRRMYQVGDTIFNADKLWIYLLPPNAVDPKPCTVADWIGAVCSGFAEFIDIDGNTQHLQNIIDEKNSDLSRWHISIKDRWLLIHPDGTVVAGIIWDDHFNWGKLHKRDFDKIYIRTSGTHLYRIL